MIRLLPKLIGQSRPVVLGALVCSLLLAQVGMTLGCGGTEATSATGPLAPRAVR